MRRLAALALLSCASAPAAPPPVPAVDAGGSAPASPASPATTAVVEDGQICFVRGSLHQCVRPVDRVREPAVPKPWVLEPAKIVDAIWHVGRDGKVVIQHHDGFDKADPISQQEDAARVATAKKLPPLVRTVESNQGVCGLTPKRDVVCWPEPLQNVDLGHEPPIVATATKVPNVANVAELFLQDWSNLCVAVDASLAPGANNVFCSAATPARTDICVRRGNAARCGPSVDGNPPNLVGAGYDPRVLLTRPLLPVPDLAGAHDLTPWGSLTFYTHAHAGRVMLAVMNDGGCAIDAAGAVRCFERDPCPKSAGAWRTDPVGGLPPKIAKLGLTDAEGYALDHAGRLFVWPRAENECHAPPPVAKLHAEGVATLAAGYFIVEAEPMFGGLVCVTTKTNTARCWRDRHDTAALVELRVD